MERDERGDTGELGEVMCLGSFGELEEGSFKLKPEKLHFLLGIFTGGEDLGGDMGMSMEGTMMVRSGSSEMGGVWNVRPVGGIVVRYEARSLGSGGTGGIR